MLDHFPTVVSSSTSTGQRPALVVSTVAQSLGVKESAGRRSTRASASICASAPSSSSRQLRAGRLGRAHPRVALGSSLRVKILVTSRAVLRCAASTSFKGRRSCSPICAGRSRAWASFCSTPRSSCSCSARSRQVRLPFDRAQRARRRRNLRPLGRPPARHRACGARVPCCRRRRWSRAWRLLQAFDGRPANMPTRQQTMSGAIAWSYDLLDEGASALPASVVFRRRRDARRRRACLRRLVGDAEEHAGGRRRARRQQPAPAGRAGGRRAAS